jgi:hypothetical protein
VNDKFTFGSQWEDGGGQLTKSGERQHYLLGLKRRKEYIENTKLLPDIYTPGILHAESTDKNRTLMSGYAHLFGLYPPEKREKNTIELDSQNIDFLTPIPLHLRKAGNGILNAHDEETWDARRVILQKSFDEANEEFTSMPFVQSMISEVNSKLKLTGNARLVNFTDLHFYVDAYISIETEQQQHAIQFSEEFKSNVMNYQYLLLYHTGFRDDLGVRISTHNFFTFLANLISSKTGLQTTIKENNVSKSIPKTAKYYVFSGHDTTLVSFMAGIGIK